MRNKKQLSHPRMITEVMRPMELERNDGDEFYPNGIFEFHITRMIKYINQHQGEFEKVKIDVENYYRYFMNPDINQMYVEQADLERPVIFAEITPDRLYNGYPGIGEDYYLRGYNLINGHHRIHKAYQLGIKMIWAWILPMEQHYQFMSKGFEKYREYWNGKLSQVYI